MGDVAWRLIKYCDVDPFDWQSIISAVHPFSKTSRRPGQYIVNFGRVEDVDTSALETAMFDGKHLF